MLAATAATKDGSTPHKVFHSDATTKSKISDFYYKQVNGKLYI